MSVVIDNRKTSIVYDEQGVNCYELLPGIYTGGVRNYRISMEAETAFTPLMQKDRLVLLIFGMGRGYITDAKDAYNIEELCFYFPDFDKTPYTIHSITSMEFIMSVIELNEWDWKLYGHTRNRLPLFRTISKCSRMDEDCMTPETDSRDILGTHQLGRIIVGSVRAEDGGTVNAKDIYTTQWIYCVGKSDFCLTVDRESQRVQSGDFFMLQPGVRHSLVAESEKEVYYVWLKQFIREKDFKINPMPTHFNH